MENNDRKRNGKTKNGSVPHEMEKPLKKKDDSKSDLGDAGFNLPVPPDGGWGWVVVVASFLVHVLADGVVYAFGIYLVEFVDYFRAGRGETGWIASLVVAVTFMVGEYSFCAWFFINT